ncbi:MAG: Triosephosphate isomerase, bacterial/eukaryotic [Gemmatimonadetes bacterium]|nr:Triosephosphate isomerase, bacterial/eukaryotic [Gemmatimonadota bacterium]
MKGPVFAANWKMHLGPTEARAFVAAFLARYTPREDRTVVLCPPAISMSAVRDALGDRRDILLGAQNVYSEPKGAFTGETSVAMAADAGARVVLVGHSERRHVFGETDEATARKCALASAQGLVPILCVGETLEQREAGETEQVSLRQLRAGLASLSREQVLSCAIAYEPVWAIGTGRTATPADAAAVHTVIRRELLALAGPGAAGISILYGGSVNRENAAALVAALEVGGLLVGGASLDPESWNAIAST